MFDTSCASLKELDSAAKIAKTACVSPSQEGSFGACSKVLKGAAPLVAKCCTSDPTTTTTTYRPTSAVFTTNRITSAVVTATTTTTTTTATKCPKTDFLAIQSISLGSGPQPEWEFKDGGKEIIQKLNSGPGIAIGGDMLTGVQFEGTIFVSDTSDNDWLGSIFSFQVSKY